MLIAITVAGMALLGALALQGWVLRHLQSQQIRLVDRLDRLSHTPDRRGAPVGAPPPGRIAPAFAMPDLDGRTVSLAALLAPARPLLVFIDPRCGPCAELLPDLGGWQRVYTATGSH